MADTTPDDLPEVLRIRPRNNQVLVQPEPLEERVGVLFIPDTARDAAHNRTDYRTCLVLAVGPGKWLKKANRYEPVPFEPGQKILCNMWVGDGVKVGQLLNDPKAPMLIDADDVAGVVG